MLPEISLLQGTVGWIGGKNFGEQGLAAYQGSSISGQLSGELLAADGWQGVNPDGSLADIGGADFGVNFGTPSLGVVTLRAEPVFQIGPFWP
jgi:hypothetical protein